MGRRIRRQAPALAVAFVALLIALGGTVFAASKIDGHSVKVGSLPGNRVVTGSLPANRLAPGTIPASRLAPGSLTGKQIDAASLGQVPSATHAEQADSAREAGNARYAAAAGDAASVNGHVAGCRAGTRAFAGACWEVAFSTATATAPQAAAACAERGGELPQPLALVAFAGQPAIAISAEGEWTGDISTFVGPNTYGTTTVIPGGKIDSAGQAAERKYRCVLPIVS